MHSKKFALYKTLSWRVIASVTTFLLAWGFTGELHIGLKVGASEAILKMVFYYWHERVWEKHGHNGVGEDKTK